jgi:hypothetical protein
MKLRLKDAALNAWIAIVVFSTTLRMPMLASTQLMQLKVILSCFRFSVQSKGKVVLVLN